ncbi:hypothetical protein AB6A40_005694 [Gnathostoma spinigerum]|uniref:Uncharacterized protein n=1 Tax=Gnathostoma spinigerum TaxID=75299 RepID=A0ABD6EHC2_9BILA
MDISTNELKQPFRIPRRKAEDNKPRDNEQVHRKRATPEIRSPLVASSSQKKADSAFSSRIIPPSGKRRSSLDRNSGAKRSANGKQPSGGEVFDRIIGNMVNPPKERKNELQKDREETGPSGPSSANRQQQQRSTGARQLTREELDRLHFDNSACYEFLRKDGLMERLLGHKMLNGRVDSHVTLGYVACNPRDIPSRQRLNYVSGFLVASSVSLSSKKDFITRMLIIIVPF